MTGRPDILVLEDEMLIAIDIEQALRAAGYDRLSICTTEAEVRSCLDECVPTLALLDVNLGGGRTSFEIAGTLADLGVRLAFLSGYSSGVVALPERFETCPRLSKPFDDHQLVDTIDKALSR